MLHSCPIINIKILKDTKKSSFTTIVSEKKNTKNQLLCQKKTLKTEKTAKNCRILTFVMKKTLKMLKRVKNCQKSV
jgi:hypothetical protein